MKFTAQNNSGFTLIEVLIAMFIMVVTMTSIFMVQNSSLETSDQANQMNIVAMLAKNKMVETELEFEGRAFKEIATEEEGKFEAPYENYSWKKEVKEVKFPEISAQGATNENTEGGDQQADQFGKIISNFLSDSIREVTITILWPKGTGTRDYSVSTYWVDLNHEFSITP